jgi:hypothetical protein
VAKSPWKHPTVFVGAPFSPATTFKKFRAALDNVPLEFIFADTTIRTQQLLERVRRGITRADYSLFDITDWNANVSLELGLAEGLAEDYYVLFKPGRGSKREPPADLRGLQRIDYRTFSGTTPESLEYQLDEKLVRVHAHPRYIYDQLGGEDRNKKFILAMRILAFFRHYKRLRRVDLTKLRRGTYLRDAGVDEIMGLLKARRLIKGKVGGQSWQADRKLYKQIRP